MSDLGTNIHILDAAYKPFPTFAEWAAKTTVDTVRWERYLAAIENRPDKSDAALKRAYEIVKRAAAIDTGAIEGLYDVDRGFTFTVAFETAAWEVELAKKGENVRSLFEAQLHAYDYVLDLATQSVPITEAAIRRLHEVVCEAQKTYRVMTAVGPQEQELTKGRYKVLPNHVLTRDGVTHSYAPVDVTPAEMARLVNEMRSEAFLAAHPIIQAAYAHYGLVVIHPFADGNGRVARALASVFTYRAISMPIMILSDQKVAYLDALESADGEDFQSFVDFMLSRSLDTVQIVRETLLEAAVPDLEEEAEAIGKLYITKGGFTQEQVDEAGDRFFQSIKGSLTKVIAGIAGSNLRGGAAQVVLGGKNKNPDPGFRLSMRDRQDFNVIRVELVSSPPAEARVFRNYVLWLPIDAGKDEDVQLMLEDASFTFGYVVGEREPAFAARMEELAPSPSGVFQIRAGIFADHVVREMLSELKSLAEKNLRGQSGAEHVR